ncbi:MAG TPA: hypothetical protein HA354_02820 [Candidatus Poseidoniaceae archaeon]|nr:hypothetical protein [Euryarchaeota archaeon]DAC59007.1 MAG TPA: hypothetical protein D7I07_02800 [Candidatus Poseidoniales archaeon]HII37413.1 hypothetical protein [Candidatus Poseidoniaceae archaeon]|tara:strand:- start:121 stop:612 length:492 start_codon:yes stop_codon:yes gene_type:complete
MQPQDAQMMGQVAPGIGQQVIIVQNKSGGPKVFGIIAIVLGGIGVVLNGLNFTADLGDLDGGLVTLYYLLTLLAVASNGMFVYAGILLFQYRRSGVWWGFGAVGVGVLSTVIISLVIASALSELDESLGEAVAGFGLISAGLQAICCSAVVALPLLMNGADLD